MPGRNIPIVTGEIYHIVNRGIASQPIYITQRHYERFLETVLYYQNLNPPVRFSFFNRLKKKEKERYLKLSRKNKTFGVEVIAYCFMPNHFHLLLKQLTDNGISNFLSILGNSYTRYFNTQQKRVGPILQGKFKAVRIETNSQLLHVSRYIHLNPYSSFIVKTLTDLENYPYSSFPEYLNKTVPDYCQKEIILDQFQNLSDYRKFVFDQADYQRKLDQIKHLTLENTEV